MNSARIKLHRACSERNRRNIKLFSSLPLYNVTSPNLFCNVNAGNVCYIIMFMRLTFSSYFFSSFCFYSKDDVLVDWINPMYLDTDVVKDIRARFKDESEIQLQEFLLVNVYLFLLNTFLMFCLIMTTVR